MHTTPQKRLFQTPSEILVHRGVCILNGMAQAMWEEFNKIWTDENITKSIIDALGITSDFCSWFLFYLQQAVAKTYLQLM